METKANFKGFMAENIAKTYLYETEMLTIYEGNQDDFDFICMLKTNRSSIFGVLLKASQYTQAEILRKYKEIRKQSLKTEIPVLMMYINPVDRTGFFEFIKDKLGEQLTILDSKNLKSAIAQISSQKAQ